MRKYQAAHLYLGILSFISWILIIVGALLFINGLMGIAEMRHRVTFSNMFSLTSLNDGFWLLLYGFVGLAVEQIFRAVIDIADITQLQLKVARDQLEVSRQALNQGARFEPGYAARQAAKEELLGAPGEAPPKASFADRKAINHRSGDTIEYKGKHIRVVEAGYVFGAQVYTDLEEVYAHIDEDDFALNSRQPGNRPYADQLGVNRGPTLGGVTRR